MASRCIRTAKYSTPAPCLKCEDVLNKGGETWTNAKLFDRNIGFPLYEIVVKIRPEYERDGGGMYFATQNPEIEVEKSKFEN